MSTEMLDSLQKWYTRGEFGRIIYTCDELLENPAYKPWQSHLLFWKGMAKSESGSTWFGEAISCHREGMVLAGKDRPIKARHMAALGAIYGDIGDRTTYDKLMKEFATLARGKQAQVLRWGAYLWYNYGRVLDNSFHYEEAAQAYATAAELARQFHEMAVLPSAIHNLGGVRLYQGRLEEAARAMAEAEQLIDDSTCLGARTLNRRGEYALATGDLIGALQWVTSALVHPAADNMLKADTYYTWAQTLHQLGRPAEAREKALVALDFAVKAVHYAAIHKINRLLQQLGPQGQDQ